MTLMQRRRALMGAADNNPTYLSANGLPYKKKTVMTFTRTTIPDKLQAYGNMENLEEIVFTGEIWANSSNYRLLTESFNWNLYAPNVKKITIIPTKVYGGNNANPVDYFSFIHYPFNNIPHVTDMQLGGLKDDGYCYFKAGGYFRNDSRVRTVGTSAGLHLIAYRTAYHAHGGFENGNVAETTTITQYNWETGEVMTS